MKRLQWCIHRDTYGTCTRQDGDTQLDNDGWSVSMDVGMRQAYRQYMTTTVRLHIVQLDVCVT